MALASQHTGASTAYYIQAECFSHDATYFRIRLFESMLWDGSNIRPEIIGGPALIFAELRMRNLAGYSLSIAWYISHAVIHAMRSVQSYDGRPIVALWQKYYRNVGRACELFTHAYWAWESVAAGAAYITHPYYTAYIIHPSVPRLYTTGV